VISLALALTAGVAKGGRHHHVRGLGDRNSGPASHRHQLLGTLAVDVTDGAVSAADITFPGLADFNQFIEAIPEQSGVALVVNNSTSDQLFLPFTTTIPNSLVGFAGGAIDGGSVLDIPTQHHLLNGLSGSMRQPPPCLSRPLFSRSREALGSWGSTSQGATPGPTHTQPNDTMLADIRQIPAGSGRGSCFCPP
jgi:hypothetical protein